MLTPRGKRKYYTSTFPPAPALEKKRKNRAVIRITYYGPSQNVQIHANPECIIWAELEIIVYM